MKGHASALHSTFLHALLSWFRNSKSAAATSPVHQLTSKSIFVTSQQSCSLQFSALFISFTSHHGQDTTESLQGSAISHCRGCKLFNTLMSNNPQTSGTSLHQCPSKTQTLTNANQYFNYCIKLAPFCFTSNLNCFLSTNWSDQETDLNTICHCISIPAYLFVLVKAHIAATDRLASSKTQKSIFNTAVLERCLCWWSLYQKI